MVKLYGEIKHTKIQELQYQGIKEEYILLNSRNVHITRKFVFFNIDGPLDKVMNLFSSN